ncbi:hypothetical protein POM88_040850 [Heracleum sosnowskyi]|uniref:F-box domain-containing protein n=1 Tax=Heracleum sosnowskyi TaxID=360622 RepID=A0AAD8HDQ2_9APIA|nr:hypothetical protein POM88_040850 [Heracleum sosnowskyi]
MSNPPPLKKQELIVPDYVSQHVISEILLRLPVNSLLQYKSVSKSWYSLISSPSFIKSQLAVAATRANQNLIVYTSDYENEDDSSISLVNLHSCQVVAQFDYMPVHRIIGSANGIVCVDSINTYLWNPATKQYKIIHPHTLPDDHDTDWSPGDAIGFGFDPIHDDLKLVAYAESPSRDYPSIALYSVNRNVWRKVRPKPNEFPYYRNFDVCINGFLLSVGLSGMMAFDLTNEVLNCAINLPVATFRFTVVDFKMYNAHAHITEFNASIAVIISKRLTEPPVVNLWALDDEACLRGGGIEASWTLMLNINIDVRLSAQDSNK